MHKNAWHWLFDNSRNCPVKTYSTTAYTRGINGRVHLHRTILLIPLWSRSRLGSRLHLYHQEHSIWADAMRLDLQQGCVRWAGQLHAAGDQSVHLHLVCSFMCPCVPYLFLEICFILVSSGQFSLSQQYIFCVNTWDVDSKQSAWAAADGRPSTVHWQLTVDGLLRPVQMVDGRWSMLRPEHIVAIAGGLGFGTRREYGSVLMNTW
jgi:hypothetical protein